MTIKDPRALNRYFTVQRFVVPTGTANAKVLNADKRRVAIALHPTGGSDWWFSPDAMDGDNQGFNVVYSQRSTVLTFRDLGGMIQGEWYGRNPYGMNDAIGHEVLYDPRR